jgi:hypothetical protein
MVLFKCDKERIATPVSQLRHASQVRTEAGTGP